MASEPPTGVNFFLPWGFVEWAIGGLASTAVGIAVWVWNLGWNLGRRIDAADKRIDRIAASADARMDKIDARIKVVEDRQIQLQESMIRMEAKIDAKMERIETAIYGLQNRLVDAIREFPSRGFIEAQIQQLSERQDGMIDAKLAGRTIHRQS